MPFLTSPKPSASQRRNHGGPARTASLAVRRARATRDAIANETSQRGKAHRLTSWLLATCKHRPERTEQAIRVLTALLMRWFREDVAVRRDREDLLQEITKEVYR